MHLEFMRHKGSGMPPVEEPGAITSARIWHCNFRSLAPLSELTNLRTLAIATYPDDSLEPLANLRHLTYLNVLHFPRVSDLTPLSELSDLETLSLSSLPSWDVSGKVLEVESLQPLANLRRLRHLELFGVRPRKDGLLPLMNLDQLESARLSKLPDEEVKEFLEKTGAADAFNPEPDFDE
jgi:hypothetical protein